MDKKTRYVSPQVMVESIAMEDTLLTISPEVPGALIDDVFEDEWILL